jgi:transcriptional regulator with XRE-family HTH domain
MHIKERVRNLRLARGYSARELAERAGGISAPYISDIEHGRGNPSLSSLIALARGFDMTVMELLAGVDDMGEPVPPAPPVPDSLREFLAHPDYQDELTAEWAELLQRVHLRGKYFATVEDWVELYLHLRRMFGG